MLRNHAVVSRCLHGSITPLRFASTASQDSPKTKASRKREKGKQEESESGEVTVQRKRGRPSKQHPAVDETNDPSGSEEKSKRAPKKPKQPKQPHDQPPNPTSATAKPRTRDPLLLPGPSSKHHDLNTFLTHAATANLSPTTSTYRGTHYEYTVAATLASYAFALARTGRSNDLGIDLLGTWTIPPHPSTAGPDANSGGRVLRVLAQCKAHPPLPANVRELEGAYAGAPAGWRGDGVLALLVASGEATKGVREAVQRSRAPVGFLQVGTGQDGKEGVLRQMVWNGVAAGVGLEGVGVVERFSGGVEDHGEGDGKRTEKGKRRKGKTEHVERRLQLTWLGDVWR